MPWTGALGSMPSGTEVSVPAPRENETGEAGPSAEGSSEVNAGPLPVQPVWSGVRVGWTSCQVPSGACSLACPGKTTAMCWASFGPVP